MHEVEFLTNLGVSLKAIKFLTDHVETQEAIESDLCKLKNSIKSFFDIDFKVEFNSYLWTLLGHVSIPSKVSNYVNTEWPLLIFPIEKMTVVLDKIHHFLEKHECEIVKVSNIKISSLLYTCIYGGQAWFDSLYVLHKQMIEEYGDESKLVWFNKIEDGGYDVVAVARMLQMHLRPSLKSIELKLDEEFYPGIIRAFHTPSIDNIVVHKYLLSMKQWEIKHGV